MVQQIETTVGEATAELQRRGFDLTDHIIIRVNALSDALAEARAYARPRVIASGLSDEELDVLIDQARQEIYDEDHS